MRERFLEVLVQSIVIPNTPEAWSSMAMVKNPSSVFKMWVVGRRYVKKTRS